MQFISDESKQRNRIPIGLDFFTPRYKTKNTLYTFSSPSIWVIEKNLFYLLKNSEEIAFDPKYKYKPSYLSFDQYETVILDYLLMYVNNIYCIEDFNLNTVIIPSLTSIIDICKDKFPAQTVEKMESIGW